MTGYYRPINYSSATSFRQVPNNEVELQERKERRVCVSYMSNASLTLPLNLKDSKTLQQYRSTVKASLEQLKGIEQRARTPPSPTHFRIVRRIPLSHANSPACTTCGTPGCHYTECPKGHYVFDHATVPRPLATGESFPTSTSWKDLHRATLQGVLRVFGHYYRFLYTTPRHLEQARLIVTQSLGLPDDPPVRDSSLLTQAVCAAAARLRADPLTASIPGLFNSLCECYHTPVFGVSLDSFKQRVREQVSACLPSPH